MSIISKKKDPSDENDELKNEEPDQTEEELTPWQKENARYLKEMGDTPSWQPVVLDGQKEEKEDEEAVSEEESTGDSEKTDKENSNGPSNGSFADRLPHIKEQRRKILFRRLTLLITLFSIPLIFFLYYVSPYSKLGSIKVTGNEAVDSQAIETASSLKKSENLWTQFFSREKESQRIVKKLDRVKSASIQLTGINQLTIDVAEYDEVAVLKKDDAYHLILEDGTVLDDKTETPEEGYPVLENFDSQEHISAFLEAYQELSDDVKTQITTVKYAPSNANKELLNLNMADGNMVIVGIYNLTEQMPFYTQAAAQLKSKGIVDMEVGVYAYEYPTASSTETSSETE